MKQVIISLVTQVDEIPVPELSRSLGGYFEFLGVPLDTAQILVSDIHGNPAEMGLRGAWESIPLMERRALATQYPRLAAAVGMLTGG